MPTGYRLVLAALGGLIILISFGLGLYVSVLDYPEPDRYQSYGNAREYQGGTATAIKGTVAEQKHTPCENPESRDESDLCAYWRATKAAEESARWARWGFFAGLFGLFGLYWQVVLTRKAVEDTSEATEAMREANKVAERNARAAEEAAAEASRMNEAVVRCHIEIKDATLVFDEETFNPKIYITVLNSSDFPAKNFRWLYSITYRTTDSDERKSTINKPQLNTHGMTLGPSEMKEKTPVVITFPIIGDEINAMRGPKHPGLMIFVTISMLWENVFGRPVTDEQYLFGQGYGLGPTAAYGRGRAIHLSPTYTPVEPIETA